MSQLHLLYYVTTHLLTHMSLLHLFYHVTSHSHFSNTPNPTSDHSITQTCLIHLLYHVTTHSPIHSCLHYTYPTIWPLSYSDVAMTPTLPSDITHWLTRLKSQLHLLYLLDDHWFYCNFLLVGYQKLHDICWTTRRKSGPRWAMIVHCLVF